MNLEKKILLFYLGLDESDREKLKAYLTPKKLQQVFTYATEVSDDLSLLSAEKVSVKEAKAQEKDLALMHIIRYLIQSNKSNVELAEAIENYTNEKVSRPEKRGRYELKGKLLEFLLTANDKDLMNIRNALVHMDIKAKEPSNISDTNLAKWFDIILSRNK